MRRNNEVYTTPRPSGLLERKCFIKSLRTSNRLLPSLKHILEIKQSFLKTLRNIADQIPQDNLCQLLSKPIEKSKSNDPCFKNEFQNSNVPLRLYTILPLPFQCAILVNMTLHRIQRMRIENLSGSSLTKKRKITELFRKHIHTIARLDKLQERIMNGKLKELGWLIEKTESILRYRDNLLIPVARMCSKLIRKQNAYSDIIKIAIKRNKKTKKRRGGIETVKNKLRKLLPRIMGDYIRKRNITLPALNKNWQHLVPNKFILVFLKKKGTHKKNVAYSKLFYAASSSRHGSRNAHLIMTSIYDYGFDRLQSEVKAELKFSSYLKVRKKLDADFYKGELFPAFLSSYFDELPSKEKCFIIDMMSIYGNPSRDQKTIEQWKRDTFNGNECVVDDEVRASLDSTFPPSTQSAIKTSKNASYSKNIRALKGEISYKTNSIRIKQMTDVEIIMISVLVLLLISSTTFLSVYCTYTYKMKQMRTLVAYNLAKSEQKPGNAKLQVGDGPISCSRHVENSNIKDSSLNDKTECHSIIMKTNKDINQEDIRYSITVCEGNLHSTNTSQDHIACTNNDNLEISKDVETNSNENLLDNVNKVEVDSVDNSTPDLNLEELDSEDDIDGIETTEDEVVAGDNKERETDL